MAPKRRAQISQLGRHSFPYKSTIGMYVLCCVAFADRKKGNYCKGEGGHKNTGSSCFFTVVKCPSSNQTKHKTQHATQRRTRASARARTHAHTLTSPTGGGALSLEGLRGMIPGSDKAVSHRFDMANAHSNSPTVARTPPPRTGNLGGVDDGFRVIGLGLFFSLVGGG